MNGFDNTDLKDDLYNGPVGVGFTPKLDFVYDSDANTVAITDTSTYAAGDDRKSINVEVFDRNGDKATGNMTSGDSDDAISISVAALDKSGGFTIKGTIVTNKRLTADGHANPPAVASGAGTLESWLVQGA